MRINKKEEKKDRHWLWKEIPTIFSFIVYTLGNLELEISANIYTKLLPAEPPNDMDSKFSIQGQTTNDYKRINSMYNFI